MIALVAASRPITGRVPRPKPTKYYGKCMRSDGSEVTLVAKSFTEAAACKQLHKSYNIVMVIDLLTEAEVEAAKNRRRKGSRIGVPKLI